VARYGIAAKLPLFLTSLATLVYTALFPTLARAVLAGDARRVAAIQRDTLAAVLGVAVPGALCLALVAEPLVLLLFTEKFQASVPVFAVLVWRFPLAAASGLFRTALWARSPGGDARTALQVLALTVVLLVVFAGHAGAIGAAYGMLLGDALALALYAGRAAAPAALAFVRRDWLARLGLATGVAGGLVLVLPRDAGVAAIAGALAAWAAASLVVDLPLLRRLWHEARGAADGTRPAE
jgi:O-antigen/teichoic acid export membrane protein